MEPTKPNFNSDFFEDVGDPLIEFRKKYKGAVKMTKKGIDPTDSDPDLIQAARQTKLIKDIENMNFLGSY